MDFPNVPVDLELLRTGPIADYAAATFDEIVRPDAAVTKEEDGIVEPKSFLGMDNDWKIVAGVAIALVGILVFLRVVSR